MTPIENLHYALGQLAYAVAKADGQVQKEERRKFANIMAAELRYKHENFNISDIIFKVLDDEKFVTSEEAYDSAMFQIRENIHYLSPQLKETFFKVLEKVAKSYPPVTVEEMKLLEKFRNDMKDLHGDPVYYEK